MGASEVLGLSTALIITGLAARKIVSYQKGKIVNYLSEIQSRISEEFDDLDENICPEKYSALQEALRILEESDYRKNPCRSIPGMLKLKNAIKEYGVLKDDAPPALL